MGRSLRFRARKTIRLGPLFGVRVERTVNRFRYEVGHLAIDDCDDLA